MLLCIILLTPYTLVMPNEKHVSCLESLSRTWSTYVVKGKKEGLTYAKQSIYHLYQMAISVTFLIWWLSMQGLQAALEETSYKNSSYYDILGGITNIV